jgi:chitin disaccharide deacetylase
MPELILQEIIVKRESGMGAEIESNRGALIVNADDWGRDKENTTRTLECVKRGAVSAVSAMVFMEDSAKAAEIATELGIDAGLHLNLTTPFWSCHPRVREEQEKVGGFLRTGRFSSLIYHPGLRNSFEYVVKAQLDEFRRLYGADADRIDGHHHMHLCANVLVGKLLPEGTRVRRNFTFAAGEKNFVNRMYRDVIDRKLRRRHRLTDSFFSLPPMEPKERLQKIFGRARTEVVELETHPVNEKESKFLGDGEIFNWVAPASIRSFRSLDLAAVAN